MATLDDGVRRAERRLSPVQIVLAWLNEARRFPSLTAYARSTLDGPDPATQILASVRAATLSAPASDSPTSKLIACQTAAIIDAIEETTSATAGGLRYDASAGQHIYTWKTNKAWAGSSRQLPVRLADGPSTWRTSK